MEDLGGVSAWLPGGEIVISDKYHAHSRLPADDVRGNGPAWMRYFKDGRPVQDWVARRDAIRDILASDGRTVAQGALAWNLARSPHTIPIPGCRTVAQVEENVGTIERGPLSSAQMAEIESILGR